MDYKTIVNNEDEIIDYCVLILNGSIENYELKENEKLVQRYNGNFIKPRWDGSTWVEGATEEEIKEYKEKNKTEENAQVTEEQQLLSSVLLENAEIKEQLKEQQELIATILLQNAQLKGGNTDV